MEKTKLQILAGQIQTDLNSLIGDVESESTTKDEIVSELKRIHDKIKDWSDEADKIMEEAKLIN